jgi:superfamily II DNA helicase RecQ
MLQLAYDSISRVVLAAQAICTYDAVGVHTLFEVGRKAIDTKPSTPFSARLEKQTTSRYINVWKRIFSYIFRTMEMDEDDQPDWSFTNQQEHLFSSLQRHLQRRTTLDPKDAEDSLLDRTMLNFLVSLLDHNISSWTYESALLSALAAMGVREDGGWLGPEDYTGYYSAVIKVARMLVVRQSFLEAEETDGDECPVFSIVRPKVRRFMTVVHKDNFPHPLDWIFDARTYGMKIRYTTMGAGNISWTGTTVSYRTVTFSIESFTESLHQMVNQLGRTMEQLAFTDYGLQLPPIDLKGLYDMLGDDSVGGSFLTNESNDCLQGLHQWLVRQVLSTTKLRKHMVQGFDTGLEPQFRTAAIDMYLNQVDDFRKLLLVLVHLLGGQPARTTEILSIRHMNTSYGGRRNIFIIHGQVAMLCLYHKGYSLHGQTKMIYRYLPYEVGILLVQYLVFVLPFAQMLQLRAGLGTALSPFLWSTALVRHDHSSAEIWSSDKMRRTLQRFAERYIGTPLNISSWRHIAIAIGRRYLQDKLGDGGLDESYGDSDSEDEDQIPDNILDLQAGHTSYIAHAIYARTIGQGNTGLMFQQEMFRTASTMWHRFWGFGGVDSGVRKKPRLELFEVERQLVRQRRLKTLQSMDLGGLLRQAVRNPDAKFRGNQRQALDAVVRGYTPILQVAGTGTGKSLTFLLPSYAIRDSTTIIIVPFVSLQDDIIERCRTMDIQCEIWSRFDAVTATVVLVTPESFVTKTFKEFLNRLAVRQQLDRIVLDECHTVLSANYTFRPQLRTIGSSLKETGTQLVFLTATLPPRDEHEFWTTLGLRGDRACIVRGLTDRPNIAYGVTVLESSDDVDREVIALVASLTSLSDDITKRPFRVIIYCQSVGEATRVATLLDCPSYHSQLGSKDERSEVVRGWLANSGPIVATAALGAGIDIPDVRCVIHIDQPRCLRDFVQESGRAGRDGQLCRSEVFVTSRRTTATGSTATILTEDIAEYISSSVGCRRTILSRVMDGRADRSSCEEDEQECDLCRTKASQEKDVIMDDEDFPDEGTRAAQYTVLSQRESIRVHRQLYDEFVQGLRWCTISCYFCFFVAERFGSNESYEGHSFSSCSGPWSDGRVRDLFKGAWAGVREVRAFVRGRKQTLQQYSGCFHCSVPQQECKRWKPSLNDDGSFTERVGVCCSYEDVVYQVVGLGISNPNGYEAERELARDTVRELGVWVADDVTWQGLTGAAVRLNNVQTNGLCILFRAFLDSLAKRF